MLALAPTPVQQHPSFYSQPSDSTIRTSRSLPRRTSSSSSGLPSSSSSSSTVTAPSASRSSHREGPSSPRRSLPHVAHNGQYASTSSSRNNPESLYPVDPHVPATSVFHRPHLARTPSSNSQPHIASDLPPNQLQQHSPVVDPPATVDIHAFDSQELLRLLASLLAQIATTNDALTGRDPHLAQSLQPPAPASPLLDSHHPPIWRTLTTASRNALSSNMSLTFHARNIPTITLEAYLLRILRYCPASNEVFLSLLVYFDRMSKLAKEACGKDFVIDSYNIHRLVIAGVTVASKFFSDVFYTNSRYAKVGGLPQAELNQLELQFLLLNDFRLMISKEEMQRYAEQLIHFSFSSQSQQPAPELGGGFAHAQHDEHHHHHPPYSTSSPSGPAKFMSSVDGFRERRQGSVDMDVSGSGSGSGSGSVGGAGPSGWDRYARTASPGEIQQQQQQPGSRTPQVHPHPHAHTNMLPGIGVGVSSSSTSSAPAPAPTPTTDNTQQQRAFYRRSTSSSAYSSASEDVETETDSVFEGSTDDEPTIRAGAQGEEGSDAESVWTVESESEDEGWRGQGRRSREEEEEEGLGGGERDYRMMSP